LTIQKGKTRSQRRSDNTTAKGK